MFFRLSKESLIAVDGNTYPHSMTETSERITAIEIHLPIPTYAPRLDRRPVVGIISESGRANEAHCNVYPAHQRSQKNMAFFSFF
jgi:hypothetical protein